MTHYRLPALLFIALCPFVYAQEQQQDRHGSADGNISTAFVNMGRFWEDFSNADADVMTRVPPRGPNLTLIRSLVRDPNDITDAAATPIPGLYQIAVDNEIFYLSEDGRYLLRGEMLDLQSRSNLTEQSTSRLRKASLAQIPHEDFINYSSADEHFRVTVFLDTDCAYCRVVHDNLAAYNHNGISIRIAAFPRGGLNSAAYQRAVNIWCAADRKAAFANAVNGQPFGNAQCDSPVKQEYMAGLRIGVNGTPTFVLEDGSIIAGYVAPENLRRILQAQKAGTAQ